MELNQTIIQKLIREAEDFEGGLPQGLTGHRLSRDGIYEEPGLVLTQADIPLTRLYAALAIYTRDLYRNRDKFPDKQMKLLEEVVASVNEEERSRWGSSAFPYDDPAFPFASVVSGFPPNLAEAAANLSISLEWLDKPDYLHEWTLKAGKRLFTKFVERLEQLQPSLKEAICSQGGPFGYVQDKKPMHMAIETTVDAIIPAALAETLTAGTVMYPIGVFLSVLLIKYGLESYCKPSNTDE